MGPVNNYLYKYILFGLTFFSFFFVFIYFLLPYPVFNGNFAAFLTGARIISSGSGSLLYDKSTQFSVQSYLYAPYHLHPNFLLPYRYLPVLALIYIPLTAVHYPMAFFFNLVFMLFQIFIIFFLAKKNFFIPFLRLIPFAFTPTIYSLLVGQPSVIMALSFFLIFHFFRRKQWFISGLSLTLLLIKPHLFLLSLPLLLSSRPPGKFFTGIVCGVLLAIVTSLFLIGPASLLKYPEFVLFTESPQFGTKSTNLVSLPLFPALVIYLLLLMFAIYLKPSFKSILISLPIFLCSLSGHTYSYDLVILLFPLIFLLRHQTGLGLFLLVTLSLSFPFIPNIFSWILPILGLYLLIKYRLLK
jgi:hypothetical protein